MSAMKSQVASSLTSRFTHDVFLSFRGKDTRKGFTDHLHTALLSAGFHTFRDDDGLEKGECIKSELERAIRDSRMSIIVFSKSYASSIWCLDELVMILKCRTYGHVVLPVFYDVDPSEVRKQKGNFKEAFARHEEKLKSETGERKEELNDKVGAWRNALRDVAGLAGMNLKNQADGHEARFIQKIIEVVRDKVSRATLDIAPHPVGIYPQCVGCHKNSKSLHLCTEGLGLESSAGVELKDEMCSDWQVEELKDEMCPDWQNKISNTRHTTWVPRRRSSTGGFPPPISGVGKIGKQRVFFKSDQNEGRFVLNKIIMPTQEFFRVRREDGRLKIQLCMSDEEIFEDDEEKEEEEE